MNKYLNQTVAVATVFSLPLLAAAQDVQSFLVNIIGFINDIVIPFLFGIAFVFFVINVFRFFIFGGGNEESQDKAKALAIYSVAAFVFLIVFWGIINMLSSSIGLVDKTAPIPDYLCDSYYGDCGEATP